MTAKIARFAPRQIVTVARAVMVNAGDLRSCRKAKRRLFIKGLFGSQADDGIDLGRASRRQNTGQNGHQNERTNCHGECGEVESSNSVKDTLKSAAGDGCTDKTEGDSDDNEKSPLPEDESEDVSPRCSQSHANSELAHSLRN